MKANNHSSEHQTIGVLLRKLGTTLLAAAIVFSLSLYIEPGREAHATPTPDEIAARITQITGLLPHEIGQIYAVEQAPNILLIAYDITIPILLEQRIGYLLIRHAETGEWIRMLVHDFDEWRDDFRPFLESRGVTIHKQPNGTIDTTTPVAEATAFAASGEIPASVGILLPENTVIYTYDALGRLTKASYPNEQQKAYRYDPAGNRKEDLVLGGNDGPVDDNIPTLGTGANLINLANWPTGSAPAGPADVTDWSTQATYSNETRWNRVVGPGSSNGITAMETGQTEADANGGGTDSTNTFLIDPTKAYEFSIYFRKYDTTYQDLYVGTTANVSNPMVSYANSAGSAGNPYFVAVGPSVQATNFDPQKWYRLVGYVLPEGYPIQNNSDWGGVYDVVSGLKQMDAANFRWREDRASNVANARFFTFYSQSQQDTYTNYFYLPEVRVTDINYTPVVPSISITHVNATEGDPASFYVNLSQATTVEVRVDYVVDHPGGPGSASSSDYTAVSDTLTIPQGATQGTITVNTTEDSLFEATETIRLTLSSPVRAALSETTELASIVDDDTPPIFSVNDVSVTEGGALIFTVTKTNATTQTYTVNYATADGTALAGSDYTGTSGTLSFSSSQASRTVTVNTTPEGANEANETLYLDLSSPSGDSTISDGRGVGTINNDDLPPNAVSDSYSYLVDCCSPVPDKFLHPLGNDSDPNNDPLTIISITQPPGSVSATINSSTSIRLDINTTVYTGSMTYTISDGNGGTDTATIFINIEENE